MAFALPSFNAAVASANTAGATLQRLQSAIDFNDVNSNMAIKSLGAVPMQNFAAEVGIAKQALNEYGAALRSKMTVDYNREVLEQRKKEAEDLAKSNRRGTLLSMLTGGDPLAALLGNDNRDTRVQMQDQLAYTSDLDTALKSEMGSLHPDYGQAAAQKIYQQVSPQMQTGGGTKDAAQSIYKLPEQATPKLELAKPAPSGQAAPNELLKTWLDSLRKK